MLELYEGIFLSKKSFNLMLFLCYLLQYHMLKHIQKVTGEP